MKRKLTAQILILFFTFVLAIGLVFAFYVERDSGWEQEISTANIIFKVNGNSVNTVTNNSLNILAKGDEADFVVEASISSTSASSVFADYTIDLDLTAANNDLARAVEVYEYENGKYTFVSMLDAFTQIRGFIPINTSKIHSYKLVYSSAAGSFYEGKGFTLQLNGYTDLSFNESNIRYVRSFSALENSAQNIAECGGKTLTLLNNITVPDDTNVTFTQKIGLDLNGYTLTIGNNSSVNIAYSGSNSVYDGLGIKNSVPNVGGIDGIGVLTVSCPDDFIYVQDDLNADFASIDVTAYSLTKLTSVLQSGCDYFSDIVVSPGSSVDFMQNLHYYTDFIAANRRITLGMSAVVGEAIVLDSITNEYKVSGSIINPVTSVRILPISLYKGVDENAVELILTIRGTSSGAVAENILSLVPSYIEGSIFLPSYDESSKGTITWVVGDGRLLNKNGSYLAFGYDVLSSWTDQIMNIGVIVDIAGERYYDEKTVTVHIMSAEERTERIFNYQQIVLEELDSYLQFYDTYVDAVKAEKAGLISLNMSIEDAQNVTPSGDSYLEIVTTGNIDDIHLLNKPSVEKSVEIDVDIAFVYENIGGNVSYTISDRLVNVVGYREAISLSDPTPVLQRYFNENDYITVGEYEFTVEAYLSDGQFVDYFVDPAYDDMLLIENDVYLPDADGLFVLDGDYRFATAEDTGDRFNRVTRFKLLPSQVPNYDITVPVTAKIWEEKVNNVKVYLRDTNELDLIYNLSLAVEGIYHNTPTEIADFNLYTRLLDYFDADNDGWLKVKEAEAVWQNENLARNLETVTIDGIVYNYVDLSSLQLSNIKGLEYFTEAVGFDLSDNNLTDISALSDIFTLKYLDLGNNLIADTSALRYLDNVEILYLNNNAITDISPIQYLTGVTNLNLSYNNSLKDFSPLTYYSSLKALDITQATADNVNTQNVVYNLALIGANNHNVVIDRIAAEGNWVAAPEQIVAAKALSELVSIYEAYNTLYIPTSYYYEYTVDGVIYRDNYTINWSTLNSEDSAYLNFTVDGTGNTNGYVIVSPIVDRSIAVAVKVTKTTSNSITFTLSRNIDIKLLKSQDSSTQLYIEAQSGVYTPAEAIVPDPYLLNLLFRDFNTTTTGNVTVNGTARSEKYILNSSELSTLALSTVDWRNKGITDLTGLRYFAGCFDGATLYLQGNKFVDSDISELAYLDGLIGLFLDGQEYDFSTLVPTAQGAEQLTTLQTLVVYGCYNLDSDMALSGLYRIYLTNPNSNIYIESNTLEQGTEWDPYELILLRYSQSLPMSMTFTDIGQEHLYFEGSNHYFTFNFYNVLNIDFRLTAPAENPFLGFFSGNFENITETVGENSYVLGVRYNTLVGYTDTVYGKVFLSGNDGRNDLTVSHYTLLKCEFNHKISVTDYSQGKETSIDEIFPGRSLRASVMRKITDLISQPLLMAADKNSIGSGYYKDGNRYYLTLASLMSLGYSPSDTLEIDGSFSNGDNSIQGLQYLPLKNVTLKRDARLGTGEYLQGLTSLTVTNSGVDLTTLTMDIPNLTTLRLGTTSASNRFCIMYEGDDYFLSKFTGLTTLDILNCNIYDWNGLNGLVGLDIATLKIFSVRNIDYSNKNNITEACVSKVESIYNNSDAAVKNYYIGAPENDRDSTYLYTPQTWQVASGAARYSTAAATELAELMADGDLNGLGLRLDATSYTNGTLYHLSKTKEPTSSIYLPKSTYRFAYGTGYSGASNMMSREFAVTWKIHGISATQFTSLFGNSIGFTESTDALSDVMLTITDKTDVVLSYTQPTYDCMFYIEGEIGNGYYGGFDSNGNYLGTTYTAMDGSLTARFLFPMFIRGSNAVGAPQNYTSYRAFTDTAFRFAVFLGMTLVGGNYNGTGRITTSYLQAVTTFETDSSKLEITCTSFSASEVSLVYADSEIGSAAELKKYLSIYSIDGISKMTALYSLTITNGFLSDISDLANLPNGTVTTLYFYNNLISDISSLNHFTRLTSIMLGMNPIKTIEYGTTGLSVFQNSCTYLSTLGLQDCHCIGSESLELLYAGAAFTRLYCLYISNTNCVYDFDTFYALKEILTNTTSTYIYLLLYGNSYAVVTLDIITNFINDCVGGPVLSSYLYSTGIDSSTNLTTMTVNGRSYTLSLVNAANLTNNSYLNATGYKTTLRVDGSANNAALIADFSVDYNYVGGNNYVIQYTHNNVTSTLYSANFDPAIWSYLVLLHTSYAGNTLTIPSASLSSIVITQDMGITSLKGLNAITCLSEISISGNRNISELWTGSFSSLTKFGLRDAEKLKAEDLAVISGCTALTFLDLYKCFGIDYLESFTLNSATTTLADIICGISTLKNISINNEYHMGYYTTATAKNILAAFLGYTESNMGTTFLGKTKTGEAITGQAVYSAYTYTEKSFMRLDETAMALRLAADNANMAIGKTSYSSMYTQAALYTANPFDLTLFDELLNLDTGRDGSDYKDEIIRPTLPLTIYESNITTTGVYFYLPTTIWYLDAEYNINWTVVNYNDTAVNLKSLCMDTYMGGVRLYMDNSNFFNNSLSGVNTLRIRGEITVYGASFYYDYLLKIERSTIITVTPSATTRMPIYYFELTDSDPLTLTPANEIITSPALLHWLFNDYTSPLGNSLAFKKISDGWYMTYEGIRAVTSLKLAHKGITTLEGIQVFENLTSLYIDRGAVISLEPLSEMALTSFAYDNSISAGDNIIVQDFSPLYASRNTLTTFRYAGYSNVNVDDLSFLMSFGTQLTSIYLIWYYNDEAFSPYNSQTATFTSPYYTGYLETTGFQYIVSWFELNRPNTEICVRNTVTGIEHIDLSEASNANFNRFHTTVDQKRAADLLSKIDSTDSDVTYTNNFELAVSTYTNDFENNIVGVKLPSNISIGGNRYVIEWTSMSSFLDVSSLTFYGTPGIQYSFTVSEEALTLQTGDVLTLAQAQAIQNLPEYQNLLFRNECSIFTTVNAVDILQNQIGNFYIVARIRIGDYDFDRVFNMIFDKEVLVNIYTDKLDVLLAESNILYDNYRYSATNIGLVRNTISTAKTQMRSVTDVNVAMTIYQNAVLAVEAVPKKYSVTYYDENGEIYGTPAFIEEGTEITLLTKPASFSSLAIRWKIGTVNYNFGSTFTMLSADVTIEPLVTEIAYYLVKNTVTTIEEVTSDGYKFSQSSEFGYYLKNMQFTYVANHQNTKGDYKVVSVFTGSVVTVASAYTFPSGSFNISLTITDTESLNSGTMTASQNSLYYTLMGSSSCMGGGSINWYKPDHRYPLIYDEDLDLYYIEMTWSGASGYSTSVAVKFVAVNTTWAAGPGQNPNFTQGPTGGYTISYNAIGASTANIAFTATANQKYTLYFDYRDSCYTFNGGNPLVADEADTSTRDGFRIESGDSYKYFQGGTSGNGGALILEGDFETTKSQIPSFRD